MPFASQSNSSIAASSRAMDDGSSQSSLEPSSARSAVSSSVRVGDECEIASRDVPIIPASGGGRSTMFSQSVKAGKWPEPESENKKKQKTNSKTPQWRKSDGGGGGGGGGGGPAPNRSMMGASLGAAAPGGAQDQIALQQQQILQQQAQLQAAQQQVHVQMQMLAQSQAQLNQKAAQLTTIQPGVVQPSSALPLPMCAQDMGCALINDASHYTAYLHTCRMRACPDADKAFHCALFVHPVVPAVAGEKLALYDTDTGFNTMIDLDLARMNVGGIFDAVERCLQIPKDQQLLTTGQGTTLREHEMMCVDCGITNNTSVLATRVIPSQQRDTIRMRVNAKPYYPTSQESCAMISPLVHQGAPRDPQIQPTLPGSAVARSKPANTAAEKKGLTQKAQKGADPETIQWSDDIMNESGFDDSYAGAVF